MIAGLTNKYNSPSLSDKEESLCKIIMEDALLIEEKGFDSQWVDLFMEQSKSIICTIQGVFFTR